MTKVKYDKVDLKVKELLGIDPYPNTCELCGTNYQINKFEINILDGNVYCGHCHQPIKLGSINHKCLANVNSFKMNTLRKKKKNETD